MKTGPEKRGIRSCGALFLIFFPFLIGSVCFRFWRAAPALSIDRSLFCVLFCLVFSASSVYGYVITPLAMLLFGFCAGGLSAQIPAEAVSLRARAVTACVYYPLFLAVFCAAYLGLLSSERLLDAGSLKAGHRLKSCLLVSLIQILMIVGAYFAARSVPIL